MENKPQMTKEEMRHKVLTIIGIVLCAILTPILIINCIMIVQSLVNDEDEVPGIFGVSPMIVLTESMEPTINAGDIILIQKIDAAEVAIDDVICFFDPAGNGTKTVTHRVKDIRTNATTGLIEFQTWGDNNNGSVDKDWASEELLIGRWTGTGIPLVGHIAMFMQTPYGLIICILVPLGALLGYELYRRRKEDATKQGDVEALMQELEALKAAQAANGAASVEVKEPSLESENTQNE